MNKSAIVEKLREIVKNYVPDTGDMHQLNEDSNFLEDLKINSAHLVDIILDIEEGFDIEISDDDAENMINMNETVSIIQQKLKEKE